ncbi:recombinase family protein [Hominifimenecus sp. rT4P-3]|uniref:recombinase family protein n=1 Tax=Hominifimenecus sp. rT4P-3 TaxID=3242979 RepID=UPI003DA37D4C
MTAAAYIRVSTEDQTEYSPASQRKKIDEYVQSRGIVLPEEYIFVDEGISGRKAEKRPAFMRMIAMARQKPRPFDQILVWKFSRFARNRQDSILYKSMLKKECGIEVVSITEPLGHDPSSVLMEALLEAMDEYYSINLAQEVRRGMNEKFSRGGTVTPPPFGYRMGEEGVVPDEREASIVRAMFEAYRDGASCREIVEVLNQKNIRTIRGNPWDSRGVRYVLGNPFYAGKQRRSKVGRKAEDRYRSGAEFAVVEGNHRAILSEELFLEVQEQLMRRGKQEPRKMSEYPLQGLVRCGSCGRVLTRTAGGTALQCPGYSRGSCGKSHFVSMKSLEGAVWRQMALDWEEAAEGFARKKEKNRILRAWIGEIIYDAKDRSFVIRYRA